jgi:hypothetical protein
VFFFYLTTQLYSLPSQTVEIFFSIVTPCFLLILFFHLIEIYEAINISSECSKVLFPAIDSIFYVLTLGEPLSLLNWLLSWLFAQFCNLRTSLMMLDPLFLKPYSFRIFWKLIVLLHLSCNITQRSEDTVLFSSIHCCCWVRFYCDFLYFVCHLLLHTGPC